LLHPIRNEIPSPEKPGYPARLFAYLDMWKKWKIKRRKLTTGIPVCCIFEKIDLK
jgi:hypothetical protein